MAKNIKDLIDGNASWVKNTLDKDPEFFDRLSAGQAPKFLWIGCADSRVPASVVTEALPGSIFVQRNIANMVVHTDSNLLSVVNYAVKALKVEHIIICGHYGCGGVAAAMSNDSFGFLDNWLMHIKDVYRLHEKELDAITDNTQRHDRFVELNVVEQVNNLAKVSFIQEEWATGNTPQIHGWVFSLKEGLIKDLGADISSNKGLEKVYQYTSK